MGERKRFQRFCVCSHWLKSGFNFQRMIRFVQRRLAGSTVGVDGKGKKWQVMVSVLCNRRPLIVDDFGATAGQIKHVNMDLQSKVSIESNWENTNDKQQRDIKLKAQGKLKGEIGFFDSHKAILEKRSEFYAKFNEQISHEDQLHTHPTSMLTLTHDETILPMAQVKDHASLAEAAEELMDKEYPDLEVKFTSPFPIGHYRVGFGAEARQSTGIDGLQVFMLHGYVTNGFDLVFDDNCWKTEEEFDAMATAATTPTKRAVYREICA